MLDAQRARSRDIWNLDELYPITENVELLEQQVKLQIQFVFSISNTYNIQDPKFIISAQKYLRQTALRRT